MTVLLLQNYAIYGKGSQVDLDNVTEASLVAQGLAVSTVNQGSAYFPLTPTEQQKLRDYGIPAFDQPSSAYKLFIPGSQFVTSGAAQDRSGNLANAQIAAAYTDAACWANPGVITTGAGVELYLTIPVAKVSVDLRLQSMMFCFEINKATPAGNDSIFGNTNGAALTGFGVVIRNTGKLSIRTATDGATQTVLADSTAVFADGSPHTCQAFWDQRANTVALYRDGTLSDVYSNAWTLVSSFVPQTRDFCIGGLFQSAGQTSAAMRTRGIHQLAWNGGLPSNVGLLAQKHSANPMDYYTDGDIRSAL